MERFTIQQCLEIVKKLLSKWVIRSSNIPCIASSVLVSIIVHKNNIWPVMEKLEATGFVADQKTAVRQRRKHSNENKAAVRESVHMNPEKSIFKRSQELGISLTTTWRILQKDLGFHPYKIVLTQELKPNDHRLRRVTYSLTGLWNNLKLTLLSTEKSSLATMFSSTHNVIKRTSK